MTVGGGVGDEEFCHGPLAISDTMYQKQERTYGWEVQNIVQKNSINKSDTKIYPPSVLKLEVLSLED